MLPGMIVDRPRSARRSVALIVVIVLVVCAVMFVGLPGVLDPFPADRAPGLPQLY